MVGVYRRSRARERPRGLTHTYTYNAHPDINTIYLKLCVIKKNLENVFQLSPSLTFVFELEFK